MALKVALVVVGLLFVALAYPMVLFIRQDAALSMLFSVYVTLGVFLLVAARHPEKNGSLIAFTAWSSFAHAGLMGFQTMKHMVAEGEMIGVIVLIVIWVVLLVLGPRRNAAAV